MLRFFILATYLYTCRNMLELNSRISSIHRLSTRSCRGCTNNIHICHIEFYIKLFSLWQYHHSSRRSVYTPLCFSLRNALYTVYSCFKLQSTIYIVTCDFKNNLFVAPCSSFIEIHYWCTPSFALAIFSIHTIKVASKNRSLISTCASTYFHYSILRIFRVFRNQHIFDLFL